VPPRGRAVAFVRLPRAHLSGPGIPLEHHDATFVFTPTSASLSLSSSQGGRTKPPLPPLLRRACTRSPSHHRVSNPANRSALNPSTPSSAPRHQPSNGRVTLPVSATAVPHRRSSARRLTMARFPRSSSSSASRRIGVGIVRGCSPRV
jgi:hypothetical protein